MLEIATGAAPLYVTSKKYFFVPGRNVGVVAMLATGPELMLLLNVPIEPSVT